MSQQSLRDALHRRDEQVVRLQEEYIKSPEIEQKFQEAYKLRAKELKELREKELPEFENSIDKLVKSKNYRQLNDLTGFLVKGMLTDDLDPEDWILLINILKKIMKKRLFSSSYSVFSYEEFTFSLKRSLE